MPALGTPLPGQRPQMPTGDDEQRAVHQFTRLQILMEEWDEVIGEWLEDNIGAERAQAWGIPDTSSNPLADLSRQLSTPGLYGKRPRWTHANARNTGLTGEGGHLEQAGFFTKAVFVQYLTLGLGDMLVRFDLTRDGRLCERLVWPHNVYLRAKPDEEDRACELWELRYRYLATEKQWAYCWDVYDLGEVSSSGVELRPPSYRVHIATPGEGDRKGSGGLGDDVSHRFLLRGDGSFGAKVGDDYPFRTEGGRPILPFAHYKDADTGMLWNHWSKRGAHRGTLNAALYWSYAGYCARSATGSYVIVAGLVPGAHQVVRGSGRLGDDRNPISGNPPVLTKMLTPGALEYHQLSDDNQPPFVHEVGAGVHLPDVSGFADLYEMKQATRWGLNPSDLSRQHANPTSAAALMVSNEGKRNFSEQVEPVFRRVDLEAVQIAAVILRQAGIATFDEQGHTVAYHRIPLSPAEQRELREQMQWEEDRGQRSEVDTYRKLHPGTTEDDALAALVAVAVQRARLRAAIREALAAEGLEEEEESPPPPEGDPDDDTDTDAGTGDRAAGNDDEE